MTPAVKRAIPTVASGAAPTNASCTSFRVPPSGLPVIQLADANTCGGYPKIGSVIGADLWLLAQVPLGGKLRFEKVAREDAIRIRQEQETEINRLFQQLDVVRRALQ